MLLTTIFCLVTFNGRVITSDWENEHAWKEISKLSTPSGFGFENDLWFVLAWNETWHLTSDWFATKLHSSPNCILQGYGRTFSRYSTAGRHTSLAVLHCLSELSSLLCRQLHYLLVALLWLEFYYICFYMLIISVVPFVKFLCAVVRAQPETYSTVLIPVKLVRIGENWDNLPLKDRITGLLKCV
jgi:hypothetical protein